MTFQTVSKVLANITRFTPGEKMFIEHSYHIQLILGHSDLFVTFDRYIHNLIEIALWYLIEDYTYYGSSESISLDSLSRLARKDKQDLKIILNKYYEIKVSKELRHFTGGDKIANTYLKERLKRIRNRK